MLLLGHPVPPPVGEGVRLVEPGGAVDDRGHEIGGVLEHDVRLADGAQQDSECSLSEREDCPLGGRLLCPLSGQALAVIMATWPLVRLRQWTVFDGANESHLDGLYGSRLCVCDLPSGRGPLHDRHFESEPPLSGDFMAIAHIRPGVVIGPGPPGR